MKGLRVSDEYRKNTLSIIPGGVSVIVNLKDGRQFQYDNIKNPTAYINKVLKNNAVQSAYIK